MEGINAQMVVMSDRVTKEAQVMANSMLAMGRDAKDHDEHATDARRDVKRTADEDAADGGYGEQRIGPNKMYHEWQWNMTVPRHQRTGLQSIPE